MVGNGVAGGSYGELLTTSLVVLGVVCVAAYLAVRLASRYFATGRARGTHLLDVVARVPLEPRRSLYVVEVAGKTLLVGTSEMGLSVLSELDGAEVKARVTTQPTFAELVKSAWARRKGERGADVPAETPGRPVVGHGDGSAEMRGPSATERGVSAEMRAAERRPDTGHDDVSAESRASNVGSDTAS